MLRAWVLLLLILNGIYLSWGQGWLLAYGFGPTSQREPHRVMQQIKPEAIEIISEQEASKAQAAALQPDPMCLQSAVLDEAKAEALRVVLDAALPAQTWMFDEVATPGRWIIYMGKYANDAELAKKRSQLATLRLTFQPLSNPALAPGLSLGGFASQAQADAALAALAQRGVRTARVVQEFPAGVGYRLRLPAVDDSLQKQLPPVRAALPGQALVPCTPTN
jgi:hypothetical protein